MSRAVEAVYDHLYAGIAGGRFRPGSHLAEEAIAAELDVSRTPVREAIRRLEKDGLVVLARNSGASVVLLRDGDIEQTFQLRALLEGQAAERAATRITEIQAAVLAETVRGITALAGAGDQVDVLRATRLNAAFHLGIAEAADSAPLLALIRALIHVPMTILHQGGWATQLSRSSGYADHERILAALRARDAELARVEMQGHILRARPRRLVGPTAIHPRNIAKQEA